jgi:hypothetical protein
VFCSTHADYKKVADFFPSDKRH